MSAYSTFGRRGKPRRWLREQLLERDGKECAVCRVDDLTVKNSTLDHIMPVSRGGTGALVNLRLAHDECNSRRGNQLEGEMVTHEATTQALGPEPDRG